MELKIYLGVILRRKWIILATLALVMAVVIIGTLIMPRSYAAKTRLRVATTISGSLDFTNYATDYTDRLMNTIAKIASSDETAERLGQQFNLAKDPKVRASIVANTELIEVIVEGPTPETARDMASALTQFIVEEGIARSNVDLNAAQRDLEGRLTEAEAEVKKAQEAYQDVLVKTPNDAKQLAAARQVVDLKEQLYISLLEQVNRLRLAAYARTNSITVVDPASTPTAPSSPNVLLNLGLGALVGVVGGLGLAFLFAHLDTRLYTAQRIQEVTHSPILGEIPLNKRIQRRPNISLFDERSAEFEAMRRARTNLLTRHEQMPFQAVLVTSAEPGVGKSTVLSNLAISLAQLDCGVIIVDADLHLPELHKTFSLTNQFGLANLLASGLTSGSQSNLSRALQKTVYPGVRVITSGPASARSAELIGSERMLAIIEELEKQANIVLIDTPALLAVADGSAMARVADGAILVVSRAQSREEAVRAACQQLADAGTQLIGVVINRVERQRDDYRREALRERTDRDEKSEKPEMRSTVSGDGRRETTPA